MARPAGGGDMSNPQTSARHALFRSLQDATLTEASAKRRRWTREEDELLLESDKTNQELALEIDRTFAAVQFRRSALRKARRA